MQFEFMAYTVAVNSRDCYDTQTLATAKANALNLIKSSDSHNVSIKYNGKVFAKYEKKGKKLYYTSVNTHQTYEIDSKGNRVGEKTAKAVKTAKTVKTVKTAKTVKAKPEVKNKAGVKVGDIFYTSWGYDQTNVDWYQVVDVTESGCYILPIGSKKVGFDTVMPVKNDFGDRDILLDANNKLSKKGVFKRTQVRGYDGEVYLRLSIFAFARPWNGKAKYETPIGMGH